MNPSVRELRIVAALFTALSVASAIGFLAAWGYLLAGNDVPGTTFILTASGMLSCAWLAAMARGLAELIKRYEVQ